MLCEQSKEKRQKEIADTVIDALNSIQHLNKRETFEFFITGYKIVGVSGYRLFLDAVTLLLKMKCDIPDNELCKLLDIDVNTLKGYVSKLEIDFKQFRDNKIRG